ncbi:unnamed protein product [Notodromas monacha]|uniref:Uncharacterized protein n=1 Tax=Notodromas monacha TaxID=399045 RepID=A0A7R9BN23_9CRUS|nr:unnamed protein product [Notodromas monacha]CAG0917444.1 unnamed protein product [Notodromas monacha]
MLQLPLEKWGKVGTPEVKEKILQPNEGLELSSDLEMQDNKNEVMGRVAKYTGAPISRPHHFSNNVRMPDPPRVWELTFPSIPLFIPFGLLPLAAWLPHMGTPLNNLNAQPRWAFIPVEWLRPFCGWLISALNLIIMILVMHMLGEYVSLMLNLGESISLESELQYLAMLQNLT